MRENNGIDDIRGALRTAVAFVPAGRGLVLAPTFEVHNPDTLELVAEVLGVTRADVVAEQRRKSARAAAFAGLEVAHVRVLRGAELEREASRIGRVACVMAPIVTTDGRAALFVVQLHVTARGATMATDYWILLRKQAGGAWHRAPIPAPARDVLYLTEETGG